MPAAGPAPFEAARLPPPPPRPPPLSGAPPVVGTIHRGKVHTVRHFGIFVAIEGYRRHVLVYHEQVADDILFTRDDDNDVRIKAMEFYFPKDTAVWVKVISVTPDASGERVNGSMKAVSQNDGTDLDPTGALTVPGGGGAGGGGSGGGFGRSDAPPEENTVHRGVVKRIEAYGVFVELEGFRKHGLVHSSQVSNYLSFSREDTDEEKKAELGGVVAPGDKVWVKVVEVTPDDFSGRGPKIGCSMKLVDQSTGEDMDPNGLRYKPRGEMGGGPGGSLPLGASAGMVSRTGKIDWGHLAGDNRLYVGDHKGEYKMLEEALPPPPPLPAPGTAPATAPAPSLPPPPAAPRTVEEALAIIEQYNSQKKKSKKDKKDKHKDKKSKHKKQKDKGKHKQKHKDSKRSRREDSGSDSSDSGTDSDPLLNPQDYSRETQKVLL